MSKTSKHLIGVDLGGTKIATVLMKSDGTMINSTRMDKDAHEGPDEVIERIVQSVRKVQQDYDIVGVGVGSPGPLDSKKGIVFNSPNHPGWKTVQLKTELEKKLN